VHLQRCAQRLFRIALMRGGCPEDGDQAAADQAEQLAAMPRKDGAGRPGELAQRMRDLIE
jgi:hypothetical protein